MPVPFIAADLNLKQVRFGELEDVEKETLSFFFPEYAGKGFSRLKVKDGLLKTAPEKGFDIIQDDNMPRRYAGDFTLPRSRYYTVCRNESGDDGGTLVNELRAYSRPNESGLFLVVDSTGSDDDCSQVRSWLKPGAKAVFCVPRDTPAFPTPFAQRMGIDRPGLIVGVIPVGVSRERIDKVIDLRIPAVQRWFTAGLTSLRSPMTNQPFFPIAGPLTDFIRLLPALLAQSLGDNRRVTQAAGIWLRRLGAHGLCSENRLNP